MPLGRTKQSHSYARLQARLRDGNAIARNGKMHKKTKALSQGLCCINKLGLWI